MNTKTKAEAAKSGKAQRELFDIMASSNKIDKILTLVAVELGRHIFDPCSKFIANLIGLTLEFSQN